MHLNGKMAHYMKMGKNREKRSISLKPETEKNSSPKNGAKDGHKVMYRVRVVGG